MATVVVIITSMVVANAVQAITTPNAAFISYSLAAGANSAVITPATNRSVLVMGCCTTSGDLGLGQVSLLHVPSSGIQWVGQESGLGAITHGNSGIAGTKIMSIDVQAVQIETAGADTIRVHNGTGFTRAGNVTLVW